MIIIFLEASREIAEIQSGFCLVLHINKGYTELDLQGW
jgi:hypothetical protein